ncbi:Panacea domain-containing protein [Hyphococcus luteus]|uniref:Antitoxin SocA-like Panacea domain-containing protein n=1 Tax=Hyphococcus luteus TaxID=2058213 RepID=A0A2S7K9E1_9PROT|nr:type II toxin-antitoxin system antitoxin SocA domain-containing protein [Marinicaulis flavus]PQA89126.1 hypothetical protein CW354_04050 [Marinicaulis flavus]
MANNRVYPLWLVNTFLDKYGANGDISHMKAQKLAYLTHGHWLQTHDEPFLSENPQVWTYGPVFSTLYQDLKDYRNEIISHPVVFAFDDDPENPTRVTDPEIVSVVEKVWKKYGKCSGTSLSDLTHAPNSPWSEMAKKYNYRVPKGLEIPVDLIKKHYRTQVPSLD